MTLTCLSPPVFVLVIDAFLVVELAYATPLLAVASGPSRCQRCMLGLERYFLRQVRHAKVMLFLRRLGPEGTTSVEDDERFSDLMRRVLCGVSW
jgi:hypothetical protein